MDKSVRLAALKAKNSDFAYWQSRPEMERLATVELLRQQFIKFKYGDVPPRFQSVYRVIK